MPAETSLRYCEGGAAARCRRDSSRACGVFILRGGIAADGGGESFLIAPMDLHGAIIYPYLCWLLEKAAGLACLLLRRSALALPAT